MSTKTTDNAMPTYQELVDNLAAAEQLEWEAARFNDLGEKRKANLHYFAIGGVVTLTSVYFVAIFDLFSGFPFQRGIVSAIAGVVILLLGLMIFIREAKSVKSLLEEAAFRRNLALELVRPIRDILYLAAEKQSFSEYQVTSLQIRLSRFPVDEALRSKEKSHE